MRQKMVGRRSVLEIIVGGTLLNSAPLLGACDIDRPLSQTRMVYLVRHAEKSVILSGPESKDPPLSDRGRRRAQGLARALAHVELGAIFATEYKRTQQTVEPCSKSRQVPIEVVSAADTAGLVQKIRHHTMTGILVAGHSNTIPVIAKQLGVTDGIVLREADYGDLFIIINEARKTTDTPVLERRRFDP